LIDDERAPAALRRKVSDALARTPQRAPWSARLSIWLASGGPRTTGMVAATVAAGVTVAAVGLSTLADDRESGIAPGASVPGSAAPAPTVGGRLAPGRFAPAGFGTDTSIVLDEGWSLEADSEGTFQIVSEVDGDLMAFTGVRPIGVGDPATERAEPLPDDLASWLESHPSLQIEDRRQTQVAGRSAVHLSALSTLPTEGVTGASLMVLEIQAGQGYNLEAGIAYEFVVVDDSDGPTVFIGSAPVRSADAMATRFAGLIRAVDLDPS
jgi:hypothetical protein